MFLFLLPHTPYKGVAAKIPGKIEVENYDEPGAGSIGKSYADNDAENKSGAYREDGVDIEELSAEPGSFVIGYTEKGEWLKYTVKVADAVDYSVTARVASAAKGSAFHLEMDDKPITDTVKVDSIGGWGDYKEIKFKTSEITAGEHVLKLSIDGSYVNIDWLDFVSRADTTAAIGNKGVRLGLDKSATYKVFDLNGNYLGVSAGTKIGNLGKGVYMLKGNGKTLMIRNNE